MSIGVAGDKQVEGGFFSEPLPESEDSDATLLNAEVEASFADGDVSPEESSEELKDQEGDGYHFPSCDEASGTRPSHQHGRGGERRILGIRLHGSCMVYRLAASFPGLVTGDRLLVQTKDGEAEGRVMFVSHIAYLGKQDQRKLNPGRITRIIRKIEEISAEQVRENREKEIKAKILGRELVRQAQLPMKLSRVNYQPGGTKAVFYFTSEDRVDFRELVKKLTEELSVRIEMRHVGVRDETRLLGGVGHCGKDFCCSQYLKKFHPVSVRMAKNQDLSLNPDGISGVCGRLMCCLAYENDAYSHLRESLPAPKGVFWTKDGREVVIRNVQPLRGSVTCQFVDGTRENCQAENLLPEKPVAGSVAPVGEEVEEKPSQVEVIISDPLELEVRLPEEGVGTGESRRRSRRKKGKKKGSSSPAGITEPQAVLRPQGRQDSAHVLVTAGGNGGVSPVDGSHGGGEGGNSLAVRKKRRRKKKKNPNAGGTLSAPESV